MPQRPQSGLDDTSFSPSGEGQSNIASDLFLEQFNIIPSYYTSLGFLLFFVCLSVYYLVIDHQDPVMDQIRLGLVLTGVCISAAAARLFTVPRYWGAGHATLFYGLCGLYLALQALTGTGIRNATTPITLVLLFYVGAVRSRQFILTAYAGFVLTYVVLYGLERQGVIPGIMPDKWNLTISLLMLICLASVTLFLVLARNEKEKRLLSRLEEDKAELYRLRLEEQEIDSLYRKQLAISQTKQQFLSFLAHEVKNPLLAMQSAVELFDNATVDIDTKARILKSFGRQVDELLPMIANVLEAGRLDSLSVRLTEQPFNIERLCADVVDFYRPIASSRGMTLHLDVRLDQANFLGDSVKLRQMVSNYVSNALKYSQAQHVWLNVFEPDDCETLPERTSIQIEVRDDGKGFSDDQLAHLFQEYALEDSSANLNMGTGLGLSIVKKLSGLMYGEVGAFSAGAGHGALFWFSVQLKAVTQPLSAE